MGDVQNHGGGAPRGDLVLRIRSLAHWNLFRISDFELRIWGLRRGFMVWDHDGHDGKHEYARSENRQGHEPRWRDGLERLAPERASLCAVPLNGLK